MSAPSGQGGGGAAAGGGGGRREGVGRTKEERNDQREKVRASELITTSPRSNFTVEC